jgi:hypothetical protein
LRLCAFWAVQSKGKPTSRTWQRGAQPVGGHLEKAPNDRACNPAVTLTCEAAATAHRGPMLSAVYYPHTTLHVEDIAAQRVLKRSLLLWDELEFIVPFPGFRAVYQDAQISRAIELVGVNHYPTHEEKRLAHEQIEDLVTTPDLPEVFFVRGPHSETYDIYPEKLLPETWDLIQQSRLAVRADAPAPLPEPGFSRAERRSHYPTFFSTSGQAGLAVMSILADCCAGTTRNRVTDRSDSYAKLTSLLAQNAKETQLRDRIVDISLRSAPDEELLIALKLSLLDVDSFDIGKLIEFRELEAREAGHTLRDLRHRYVKRIEEQVKKAATTAATGTDIEQLEREFAQECKDDVAALQQELGMERRSALLSKDVLITIIAGAGSLALALFANQFHVPTVFTLGGLPITAGGLFSARDKFVKSRSDLLRKHPMAFLHELGKG